MQCGKVICRISPDHALIKSQSDYPATVSGNIALISRGTCEFGLKSALAGAAGAVGALIYNNVAGPPLQGTLGVPPRPEGDYVASISITQELGAGYASAIAGGANISATIDVLTDIRNISTYNVLATSNTGDQDNKLALGAHTDSVAAGPGINDDGSGTVGILEVAKALSKYKINNAVTFGFWAGEEEGLLGSTYYVENLPAAEAAKIRAYLNFDMVSGPSTSRKGGLLTESRLLRLIISMQSTMAMVAPSTCLVLLGLLRSNTSSRTTLPVWGRTSPPRLSMAGQTMVLSSTLGFHPEVCSLVQRRTRLLRKPWRSAGQQTLLWTSATIRLVITLPTLHWTRSRHMLRALLLLLQHTHSRGRDSLQETQQQQREAS